MRHAILALTLVLSGTGLVPKALAEERVDAAALGQAAYRDGHYREALDHFQRAYELSGAPILLFHIGQSADRLRLDATALRAFELYLVRYPDAPNRDEVEHRIFALRKPVASKKDALQDQLAHEAVVSLPPVSDPTKLTVNIAETLVPSPYGRTQSAPDAAVRRDEQSVFDSPWFWVATSAVALALTTMVIVVASSDSGAGGGSASIGGAVTGPR